MSYFSNNYNAKLLNDFSFNLSDLDDNYLVFELDHYNQIPDNAEYLCIINDEGYILIKLDSNKEIKEFKANTSTQEYTDYTDGFCSVGEAILEEEDILKWGE